MLTPALIRYLLSSGMATATHIAVAYLGIEFLALNPGLANGIAFLVANTASYALNTRWTFRQKPSLRSWQRFFGISLIGGGASALIAGAAALAGLHYLVGIGLVILLIPGLSFYLHRRYTWATA